MKKMVRFGGPHLGFGQRTWFDDLFRPIYNDEDIEYERYYGNDAIEALSRGGTGLRTSQSGGRVVEIGAFDALAVIAIDPKLVWCNVPRRDEHGRFIPKPGKKPIGYGMVHAYFGECYPAEQVGNLDHYLSKGMATLIDPSPQTELRIVDDTSPPLDPTTTQLDEDGIAALPQQ